MKIRNAISILLVICLALSLSTLSVGATITVNGGKGIFFPGTGINKNATGGTTLETVTNDATFGTVYRWSYAGATTTVKFDLTFPTDSAFAVGDMVNVSFYCRYRTSVGETEYETPSSAVLKYYTNGCGVTTGSSAVLVTMTNDWKKVSLNTRLGNASNVFLRLINSHAANTSVCYEFAKPELMYFGAGATTEEINTELAKSEITSVSIGEDAIDLTENPSSYTYNGALSISDISATAYHSDREVEITSASAAGATTYTITSYAPAYNIMSPDASLKSTYTITAQAAAVDTGTYVPFTTLDRNAPSSGTMYSITTESGDSVFGTYSRYYYKGNYTNKTLKFLIKFDGDVLPSAGDRVNISFYYRYRTSAVIDGEEKTFAVPSAFGRGATYGKSTATRVNLPAISTDWQRASFTIDADADMTGQQLIMYLIASETSDLLCVEIARPQLFYFGSSATDAEIAEQLAHSEITGVTVKGAEIDLNENPSAYTYTGVLTTADISATTYHAGKPVDITSVSENHTAIYTLTSYAPSYNFLAPSANLKTSYSVTATEPYVNFENNNLGTAAFGYNAASFGGYGDETAATPYTFISKGTDDLIFDEYYTIENDAFSVETENGSTQNYLQLETDTPVSAQAGGYVYVSFYYRSYNTFVNTTTGETVAGVRHRIYPSIGLSNEEGSYTYDAYVHPTVSSRKYFDTVVDAEGEGAQGWAKFSYLQPLTASGNISAIKFAIPFTYSGGIARGDNRKLDVAGVTVIYFGVPTGNATSDTDLINSTINTALVTPPVISAVNVNGTDIFEEGTSAYSITLPPLEKNIAVSGNYGTKLIRAFEGESGQTEYVAYAAGYDFTNPNASLTVSCSVTVIDAFAYEDFAFKADGVTVSDFTQPFNASSYELDFSVLNNTESALSQIAVFAAYDASGKLLGYSTSGVTAIGEKAITLSGLTVAPASFKLIGISGFGTLNPVIKTVVIDGSGIN